MTSFQLAIYNNPLIPQQAHRLAIIPSGGDPEDAKLVKEHGYEVVQVIPLEADQLPGVELNVLYIASSTLYEDDETIALMDDYPSYDDPGIRQHQIDEERPFMAGSRDTTLADRASAEVPDEEA
jgi:hypothetical protein